MKYIKIFPHKVEKIGIFVYMNWGCGVERYERTSRRHGRVCSGPSTSFFRQRWKGVDARKKAWMPATSAGMTNPTRCPPDTSCRLRNAKRSNRRVPSAKNLLSREEMKRNRQTAHTLGSSPRASLADHALFQSIHDGSRGSGILDTPLSRSMTVNHGVAQCTQDEGPPHTSRRLRNARRSNRCTSCSFFSSPPCSGGVSLRGARAPSISGVQSSFSSTFSQSTSPRRHGFLFRPGPPPPPQKTSLPPPPTPAP